MIPYRSEVDSATLAWESSNNPSGEELSGDASWACNGQMIAMRPCFGSGEPASGKCVAR